MKESHHHGDVQSSTSRWESLSDYLNVNLVFIYVMGSLFLQSMLSWVGDLWSEQHGNMHFLLYLCIAPVKDLYMKCCLRRKETSKGNEHDNYIPPPPSTRSHTLTDIALPDLVVQSKGDESDYDARSVSKNEEWFLSPQSFPKSTKAERTRFLRARKGDVQAACVMLKNYLDWRAQFEKGKHADQGLNTNESDTSEEDPIWSKAYILASSILPSSSLSSSGLILPCIVFFPDADRSTGYAPESLRTVKGKRVLQHLPARIDLAVADAEVYATALALYIDLLVPRDSTEKICVVIDARPGRGWSNIPAPMLVPFIKHAAHLLNELHPERLDSCILFPVPYVFKFLWNAVNQFLDPATANKVCLLSGSASMNSPVPDDMELHLQREVIAWMEWKRLSTFASVAGKKQ